MYTFHVLLFCSFFVDASSQGVKDRCKLLDTNDLICKDCPPGYLGKKNCSEICRYPNYGKECQGLCKCEEDYCDIATGCFSPEVGCRAGYFGVRCVNTCRFPNYGKGCQNNCRCSKSSCNFITGCDASENTNQKEFPSPKKHTAETASAVVIGIVSSFSVTVIIAFVILRLTRFSISHRRSFPNVSPIHKLQTPQKATSQQHVSSDLSQRTDTYCLFDTRPYQYFNHTLDVSTDDTSPEYHGKVRQRVGSGNTILFDISSSYESDIYTIQKDKF